MALLKELEVKNTGIIASYWKIAETHINWNTKSAVITLFGFVDEQARRDEKQPIDVKQIQFNSNNVPFTYEGNNVAEGYVAIKEYPRYDNNGQELHGEFADALDV